MHERGGLGDEFLDEYGRHDQVLHDIAKRKQNQEEAEKFRRPAKKMKLTQAVLDSLFPSLEDPCRKMYAVWPYEFKVQWAQIDLSEDSD